jgi:transcriptional regulator with XRE-family HTH domain
MENMNKIIAMNLRRMRQYRGWSQEKLGEEANISRVSITHVESGEREPSLHTLQNLAEALGCKVVDFFYDADPAALLKVNMSLSEAADRAIEEGDEARYQAIFNELQEVTRQIQVFGPFTEASSSKRRRERQRAQEAPAKDAEKQASTG